jgi:hypothetical protein
MNKETRFHLTENCNYVAAIVGVALVTIYWYLKCRSETGLSNIGIEVPNFLISLLVLGIILIIWLIRFCMIKLRY